MSTFTGTAGNDNFVGTNAADVFDLFQGGDDTASGGGGVDTFNLGGAFNAADSLDGGGGNDVINLDGDYSSGLVLLATTLVNIEKMVVAAGHSYSLTFNDGNVAAGATFVLDGSALGASDVLTFNGSAELDGNFTLRGGAGADVLRGGHGDDTILAAGGNDTIDASDGGADAINGNAGNDTIFMGGALTAADTVNGGPAGTDVVQLAGDYSAGLTLAPTTLISVETLQLGAGFSYNLTFDAATIAAGAVMTVDASALTSAQSLTLHGSNAAVGSLNVTGGAGGDFLYGTNLDDTLNGGAGNDFISPQTGTDTVVGGAGKDTFQFNSNQLDPLDQIDGQSGNDTLAIVGPYAAALVFNPTTIVNVETIQFAAGYSYNLTIDNGNVAAGATLNVDASTLGISDVLQYDGSAEHDGIQVITGGAGNDTLIGGWQNDTINGGAGSDTIKGGPGSDTLNGGDGDDGFYMNDYGGQLIPTTKIDGGNGNFDTVYLNGDYSLGVTLAAATMVNVEYLNLAAGHGYKLTTNDGNVAAGKTLIVQAGNLTGTDSLNFDGSAETNGTFSITSGTANTTLKGGAGSDYFSLTTLMTAATAIDGKGNSGGFGDTLALNADYSAGYTLTATNMVNIERLAFASGHSYYLTSNDANVASGARLAVDGSSLLAGDTLIFNGVAETNGAFDFTGGQGNDILLGGAGADTYDLRTGGNDTVNGGGGDDIIQIGDKLTASDSIGGGAGYDTVEISGDYSAGLTFGSSSLFNIEDLYFFSGGHSAKLTMNDANVAAGATLKIDASNFGAADVLTFNGSAETNGNFNIVGGAGNDSLTGGGGNDTFDLHLGGVDTALGGGGNDSFLLGDKWTSADKINGGNGFDTLHLDGEYWGATAINFAAGGLFNIEKIVLDGTDHKYNITMNDSNLVTGQTLTVDASGVGFTGFDPHLSFDGSAESSANFVLIGSMNADVMGGGGGTNKLTGGGSVDSLFGGSGADTFIYPHVSDSTGLSFDTVYSFDVTKDRFDVAGTITGVNAKFSGGELDAARFDADLEAAITSGHLGAHHAVVWTPTSGSFAHNNNTFLIIDQNGVAGYQADEDLVINLPNANHYLGTFTTADFI